MQTTVSRQHNGMSFVKLRVILLFWWGTCSTGGRDSDSLRAGRSGDRIPVDARFLAPVQIGPEAHPASFKIGTVSFPGLKRPGRGADLPPLPVPRLRMGGAVPLCVFRQIMGDLYL